MAKTIWRFTLGAPRLQGGVSEFLKAYADDQSVQSPPVTVAITMPVGAVVLDAQQVESKLVCWATVDPRARRRPREFVIAGTGRGDLGTVYNNIATYVRTVQFVLDVTPEPPPLVLHVFVLPESYEPYDGTGGAL